MCLIVAADRPQRSGELMSKTPASMPLHLAIWIPLLAAYLRKAGVNERTLLSKAGIDPRSLCGVEPVFSRMRAECFVVTPDWIGRSDFNRAFSAPAQIRTFTSLRECCDRIREILTASSTRKYVYAYWPEFDSLAHSFGITSKPVSRHFRELDRAFRALLRDLDGTNTLLMVTADHGFVDTSAEYMIALEKHPALAEMLTMPLSGESRAANCYVQAECRKAFEDYVRGHLARRALLMPGRELIEEGFFGLGGAHPHLTQRVGDYVLLMKDRYVLKDWIPGEVPYQHAGVHGGITADEMYVPLILAG